MKKFFKKQSKKEFQEMNKRVEEFKAEYMKLRKKFGFDFRAHIVFLEEGGGIVPGLKIIDVSKETEAQEKAERKKDQ